MNVQEKPVGRMQHDPANEILGVASADASPESTGARIAPARGTALPFETALALWDAFSCLDPESREIWRECIWGQRCLCATARRLRIPAPRARASLAATAGWLDLAMARTLRGARVRVPPERRSAFADLLALQLESCDGSCKDPD